MRKKYIQIYNNNKLFSYKETKQLVYRKSYFGFKGVFKGIMSVHNY